MGITITDTTKNIGVDGAGPSTTRFLLSTDGTVAGAVANLGSRSVGAVAGGASNASGALGTTVTIPAGTVAGSYFIVAVADADNTVPEGNETNNTRSKAITITP
jgi:subtilase family serine protease